MRTRKGWFGNLVEVIGSLPEDKIVDALQHKNSL
jgi:hypothetical protein